MAKLSHLLSDLQIKRWIAKGEPVAKSDGDGLTFTLSRAGTAAWVLRYREQGGRRKELTLGNYPDISLAAAREQARARRAEIDKGLDPATEKQERKTRTREAWTVRDLVEDFRAKAMQPGLLAPGTLKAKNADFEQVILPRLGARRIDRVTSLDIVTVLVDSKRTWTMTRRALITVSTLFDHACGIPLLPANPCTGIKMKAIMGARPKPRKRLMLDRGELAEVLGGADEAIGRENALAFRILLATCVRGHELARARKEHVYLDAGKWWVPDADVKTRTGFLVPLAPVVVAWFRELIDLAGDSAYVLPTRRDDRRRKLGDTPVGRTTLAAAFGRAFERGDIDTRRFTPHDTRSTAKGHLRNMGVSREISEIALNHKLKGMEGIYDVREEIPERRTALELWANFLVECETGTPPAPPKNVLPFRRAA